MYTWQWGNFYCWLCCVLKKYLLVQSSSKSKHWGRAVCWGFLRRYNPKIVRKRKTESKLKVVPMLLSQLQLLRKTQMVPSTGYQPDGPCRSPRTIYERREVCFPAPICVSSPGALTPTHCCLTLLGSCWSGLLHCLWYSAHLSPEALGGGTAYS